MKEIIAYTMSFRGVPERSGPLTMVPFEKKYWNDYMRIYNECFYEMRKELEVAPVNFYSEYSQMKEKGTFLCLEKGILAGAVSCRGNEIDDLFVNKEFQRQGLGRKLLLWGMHYIGGQGYEEIILHAAQWNQAAVRLYLETGFEIVKKEKVR